MTKGGFYKEAHLHTTGLVVFNLTLHSSAPFGIILIHIVEGCYVTVASFDPLHFKLTYIQRFY